MFNLFKLLLIDFITLIPVLLIFGDLEYSSILSIKNFCKIITTYGLLGLITGFCYMILVSMTTQRVTSFGRTTTQWDHALKGPTKYSEEIIQR